MPCARESRGEENDDLLAVDLHRALVVRVQAGDDLDQGRLAGAVVAEDAGDLAGVDGQVDALEGADGAVGLADVRSSGRAARPCAGVRSACSAMRVGHGQPTFRAVESFLT